ncbi:dedicator of cytokinesis [Anaeramoeba flamelloides]|uniref:Dedicator of cytokinesis n=1 Tax=Anaeramoeba flamelloides TaxID=1746091 RepID=A0ABQ8YY39_9EUKA|nr:dedicator of cytokinesis [Anaeramoeba flamelloides]
MTNIWKSVSKKGYALYNFKSGGKYQMSLTSGERVSVTEETVGWFRGKSLATSKIGIFPSNFIQVFSKTKNNEIEKIYEQEELLSEIESVLIGWRYLLKELLFSKNVIDHLFLQGKITQLLTFRNSILKGQNISKKLAPIRKSIDQTSKKFKQIPIRIPSGNQMTENNSEVLDIHKQYEGINIIEKKKKKVTIKTLKTSQLHFSFEVCILSINEQIELNFCLYDNTKNEVITENFIIILNKELTPVNTNPLDLETIFSDLEKEDQTDLWLICRIVKLAPLSESKENKKVKRYRRPFGCGVVKLDFDQEGELIKAGEEESNEFQLTVCLTQQEALYVNLPRMMIQKDQRAEINQANRIIISLKHYQTSLKELLQMERKYNNLTTSKKLELPSLILPNYFRDDFYLYLEKGEFPSSKNKNVMVVISIREPENKNKEDCIYTEPSRGLNSEWNSLVYYHNSTPIWNENFKFQLTNEQMENDYIFVQVYDINSKKQDKKLLCFGSIKIEQNDSIISDELMSLQMYKKKNMSITLNPKENCAQVKDNVKFKVILKSNVNTQNKSLNDLFRYQPFDKDSLSNKRKREENLKKIQQMTFVNSDFMQIYYEKIFDKLIPILNIENEEISNASFEAITRIISKLLLSRAIDYKPILTNYIHNTFSIFKYTDERGELIEEKKQYIESLCNSHLYLMKYLNNYLKNVVDVKLKDIIHSILKGFALILKFIIHSRLLDDSIIKNNIHQKKIKKKKKLQYKLSRAKKNQEFQNELLNVLTTFSQIMKLSKPQHITRTQSISVLRYYETYLELPKVFNANYVAQFINKSLKLIIRGQKIVDDEKMKILSNLSLSRLIKAEPYRKEIIPYLFQEIIDCYSVSVEELDNCVNILGNILIATKKGENLSQQFPELYKTILGSEYSNFWRNTVYSNKQSSNIDKKNNLNNSLLNNLNFNQLINANNNNQNKNNDQILNNNIIDEKKSKKNKEQIIDQLAPLSLLLIKMFNHNLHRINQIINNSIEVKSDFLVMEGIDEIYNSQKILQEKEERINAQLDLNVKKLRNYNKLLDELNDSEINNQILNEFKEEYSLRKNIQCKIISTFLSFFKIVERKQFYKLLKLMSNVNDDDDHHLNNKNQYDDDDDNNRNNKKGKIKNTFIYILQFFQNLIKKENYSNKWDELIWTKFSIILKFLDESFLILRSHYSGSQYNRELWYNFFKTLILFVKNPLLQIEEETIKSKFSNCIYRSGDLRTDVAEILRRSWYLLGLHQKEFISDFSKEFLFFILLPNERIKQIGFELYYSTVLTEFRQNSKFKFVIQAVIAILDKCFRINKFNTFQDIFFDSIINKFEVEDKNIFFGKSIEFLEESYKTIDLIQRFNQYKEIPQFEEEKTSILLQLFAHLRTHNRFSMLFRYIHKLFEFNVKLENFTEAANTLLLYSDMLNWNEKDIFQRAELGYPKETTVSRKCRILKRAILYFEKGKSYEKAIELIKILENYYENVNYDYSSLVQITKWKVRLLSSIVNNPRVFSNYYRVGFFGKGFNRPKYIDIYNKTFVYKGQLLEQLTTFVQTIKTKFPNATIGPDEPNEEKLETIEQYIQIAKVDPTRLEDYYSSTGSSSSSSTTITGSGSGNLKKTDKVHLPEYIKQFQNNYDLNIFVYLKPFFKGKDKKNEFKSLWIRKDYYILNGAFPSSHRRIEIKEHRIIELSPIQNAIGSLETKNNELKEFNNKFGTLKETNVNPFTMALNGVIDAAVNGGVFKYIDAFFVEEYLQQNPKHTPLVEKLRRLLKEQLQLLETGLRIHEKIVTTDMIQLHEKLTEFFEKMKTLLNPIFITKN